MNSHSKLSTVKTTLSYFDSVPYTCYELGHTWEPRCTLTSLYSFTTSFKRAFKLYASYYMVEYLMNINRKDFQRKKEVRKTFYKIFRSSMFLAASGTSAIGGFCLLRHIVGRFYGWHSFVVGLFVGYFCIQIERKSRRGMMTYYMAIAAAQVLWRMMVSRNMVTSVPNGEVVVFSIASAALMALCRTGRNLSSQSLDLLVGQEGTFQKKINAKFLKFLETKLPRQKSQLIAASQYLQQCHSKHPACPHCNSCLYYIMKGFFKKFVVGYTFDVGINTFKVLMGNRQRSWITIFQHFNFAMFLGGYNGIFRACNCLLRWTRNKDSPMLHGAISGAVAGTASWFYKSSTISLCLLFKVIQNVTNLAADEGHIPELRNIDRYIYTASVAIVLHAAYLEPHNIKPEIWKLLSDVSGKRFTKMFRKLLDVYGTNASLLYPDFVPDLHPKHIRTPEVVHVLASHGKLGGSNF